MNSDSARARLSGAFVAAITPMSPEGEIDHSALAENLGWYTEAGLDGVLLLGTTGEQVHLSESERVEAIELARQALHPDALLIAGVGMQGTLLTIAECRRAAEAGADIALAVTPTYYQKAMTAGALIEHYRAVADASPLPLMLYSVPGVTNITIPPAVVAELAAHPNIAGMKNSGSDPQAALAYRAAAQDADFLILSGSPYAAPGLLLLGQVDGLIFAAANIVPEASAALLEAARRGDVEGVRRHAETLRRASEGVGRFGIAGWKAGIAARGRHGGPVRSPLRNLTDAEREQVAGMVRELLAL